MASWTVVALDEVIPGRVTRSITVEADSEAAAFAEARKVGYFRSKALTLGNPDCVVCADEGCEFCAKVGHPDVAKLEPFPPETFETFSDSALYRLAFDISEVLVEREMARMLEYAL